MYSFFVLGQIPGTSITISFTAWLMMSLFAAAAYASYRLRHQKKDMLTFEPTIGNDDLTATAH